MSKLFLDLSKMTAAGEKGEKAIFAHKDGHEIHVHKSKLSPKMRAELETLVKTKMAKGGAVKQSNPKLEESKKLPPMADGGEVADKGLLDQAADYVKGKWDEGGQNIHNALESTHQGNYEPMQNMAVQNAMSTVGSTAKMPSTGEFQSMGLAPNSGGLLPKVMQKLGLSSETAPEAAIQAINNAHSAGKLSPQEAQGAINGLKRGKFADGGDVSSSIEDSPEQIAADAADVPQEAPLTADQIAYNQEIGKDPRTKVGEERLATPVVPGQPVPDMAPQASDAPPAPTNPPINTQAPQAQSPTGKEDTGYGGVIQGVNERVAGRQAQANAQQQQATEETAAIIANQKARQTAVAHDQANMDTLMQERGHILQDIKDGHIDPDKYLKDMSTVGKISTGIGLILGGIGGGMTHQENPALKYLNAQIDRNIDAQAKELGKNENLLSANMRQFGNLQAARDFTRINMNDALTHQIELAAAKNGGAQAQASAQQAIGQIHQETGMLQAKLGAQMTLNSPQSKESDVQNALQRIRPLSPDTAKEFEARYVPGVGVAQKPLSEGAVQKFNGMHEFDVAMKNLYDFAKAHSGETKLLNPQDVRYGKALAQAAQNSYREAQGLGVYKASEAPLLEGEIPADPTAFFNKYRVLPQYKAVIDNNRLKLDALKQSYQVRHFADQPQSQPKQIDFKRK